MRVNIIGNFATPSAAEWGIAQAFRRIQGIDLGLFNTRKGSSAVPPATAAKDADVQLFIRGDGLPPEFIAALSGLKVCWHSELLPDGRTPNLMAQNRLEVLKRNLEAFDLLAVHDNAVVEFIRAQCRHPKVLFVPSYGVIEGREGPGVALDQRAITIGFAGLPTPKRVKWVSELGALGVEVALPKDWQRGGRIEGKEMLDFIRACRFFLNIHFSDQLNIETRVFEVLGCRTALVSEGLSTPLVKAGEHFFRAAGPEDVKKLVSSLPLEEAQRVADAGFQEAWQNHTMAGRCRVLLEAIKDIAPQCAVAAPAPAAQPLTPPAAPRGQADIDDGDLYQAAIVAHNITRIPQPRLIVGQYKKRRPVLKRKDCYNIGFVGIWFERGQSYVVRMMASALHELRYVSDRGGGCSFSSHIFARTGGVLGQPKPPERTGKWAIPNVTAYPKYQIDPQDLVRWVRQNDIDVVCFNEEHDFALPFVLRGIAPVVTYLDYFEQSWLAALGIYDLVITSTDNALKLVRRHATAEKVLWTFDSVGLKGYYAQNVPPEARKFTFVHNAGWLGINFRKGTPETILAFDSLSRKYPDITLAVFSQAPRDKLPANVQEVLAANGRIEWVTTDLGGDLLRPYQVGRIHVYPSKLEGMGLCLLEALYCGIPTVTTDAPPMNEFVKQDIHGELIPVRRLARRADGIIFPEARVTVEDTAAAMERAYQRLDHYQATLARTDLPEAKTTANYNEFQLQLAECFWNVIRFNS
jgi:glycosyltransferase involved in cell wall biosynthesis